MIQNNIKKYKNINSLNNNESFFYTINITIMKITRICEFPKNNNEKVKIKDFFIMKVKNYYQYL